MRRLLLSATVAVVGLAASPDALAQPRANTKALEGLVNFRSPSGNIGCGLDGDVARCDIAKRDWSPPPKPASCDGDYGQGLRISRSGSRGCFVCAGDSALSGRRTLRYGISLRRGSITCTSRLSGVTCKNRRGHGFRVSRQSYRRF